MSPQETENLQKPVAYDAEGRPLYHHPPQTPNSPTPSSPSSPAQTQTAPVQQVSPAQATSPSQPVFAPPQFQTAPAPPQPPYSPQATPDEPDAVRGAANIVYQDSTPTLPVPNPDAPINDENPLQEAIDDAPGPAVSHVTSRPDMLDGENFNPQLRSQYANEPKVVHASRPIETKAFAISDKVKQKHRASKEKYPYLNLSEGEFVILDIKRHPIGMILPIGITFALLFCIMAFASFYPSIYTESASTIMPTPGALFGIAVLFSVLVVLGGAVALWVYLQNQFFMTNESVIQEIQGSLFSRHEQTVSLGSIEDASFQQSGILQTVLNYGMIRLSTEGQETTYTFKYVESPRKQIAILNNAIEAFKNGRPVNDPHDN